jgi:putative transposase
VWADSNYRAKAPAAWITANARRVLDIVLKRPGQTTFEFQKWRRIVERTAGRFGRYRRPSKDYARSTGSNEAWGGIAMIRRVSRFSSPDKHKDDDPMRRPPEAVNASLSRRPVRTRPRTS